MRRRSDVDVVRLRGALKLGSGVEEFRQSLEDLLAAGDGKIVLNLAEVPMIDSTGIGALVRCHTSARRRGGAIKLVNPAKYTLLTLKTVGVLSVFEVFDDEESATASFSH
jgi:anti-sigma B factor antagonist